MDMETIRDERLGTALNLLQRPKTARPGYVPLLAGCAFIGAATFLAYVMTKAPVLEKPASVQSTSARPASDKAVANKADFELSATSGGAAEPPIAEAVILGTEQSR